MLSALESGPAGAGRRGRIDLAALLVSIVPNARVALEPGAGTEVFGEENDLKRMLHLLVGPSSVGAAETPDTASPEVHIRREGDWIRMSVPLGPDISASDDLERRWLSRMATRHGGRLELEGGMQSIVLPADAASDQREVAELRKELAQAQQLGAAYARELAQVFAAAEPEAVESHAPAPDPTSDAFDQVLGFADAVARMLRGWTDALRADAATAAAELGIKAPLVQNLERRVTAASEVMRELGLAAECRRDDPPRAVDVGVALSELAAEIEPQLVRADLTLITDAREPIELFARASVVRLLLHALTSHAAAATPRGGKIELFVRKAAEGTEIVVCDGGPSVVASARADVLRHRVDPTALGRPSGVSLLLAVRAAAALGGTLAIRDGAAGGTEIAVSLPAR
jgi:signal transduction histidine kinase